MNIEKINILGKDLNIVEEEGIKGKATIAISKVS